MKTETIRARVEPEIKEKFKQLAERKGLDESEYLRSLVVAEWEKIAAGTILIQSDMIAVFENMEKYVQHELSELDEIKKKYPGYRIVDNRGDEDLLAKLKYL
jgi:antitoxin component of RelBE/YafQ-DinJ toxin-antitoxin module